MKSCTPLFVFVGIHLIWIATAMILLNSCQMPSVTVHGKLGDYTFTPRPPIEIEPAKE